MRPVQQRDPEAEGGLENKELGGDGAGLAEEDSGGVEAGQAQPVPSAVGRLDGVTALDGEHCRKQHRDPEKTGGGRGEDLPVRAQRQAEQEQHRDREGADLVEADPGTDLDAEILAGDEGGVTQHERALP